MSQPKQTNLREHAREVIETRADSGLEMYYEMLRKARHDEDEPMIRHWLRRVEERKRFLERLAR